MDNSKAKEKSSTNSFLLHPRVFFIDLLQYRVGLVPEKQFKRVE